MFWPDLISVVNTSGQPVIDHVGSQLVSVAGAVGGGSAVASRDPAPLHDRCCAARSRICVAGSSLVAGIAHAAVGVEGTGRRSVPSSAVATTSLHLVSVITQPGLAPRC